MQGSFENLNQILTFDVSTDRIMITSFGSRDTEKIWKGERIKGFSTDLQEMARRKLRMLNNSQNTNDLLIPPSNRLEKLKGKMKEYYSIRINDQWRIIFKWEAGNASDVTLVDYH
jgi:toxin HigB-1